MVVERGVVDLENAVGAAASVSAGSDSLEDVVLVEWTVEKADKLV